MGTFTTRPAASAQLWLRPQTRRLPASIPLLTVIVPTLNERDNINHLVDRLIAALAGVDFEIVFVDDSTDETPQIIRELRHEVPVKLIHREAWERAGGLTTAITRGLRAATGTYISVIDGDLQHPPEKLREMLVEAERIDADIVAASRYCRGGSANGLPGITRRLVSKGSKWLSKLLFYERLRHASDPGSGFFLLRRDVIKDIDLRPVGYKMLTEILVRGRWSRLGEVPYRFHSRTAGASKAGLRQGVQYLQHTARMFVEVPHVARLWKFLLVGATGVAVNLGTLWLAIAPLGLPIQVGWAAGVEASVLSNFWLNRAFTWRDRRSPDLLGLAMQGARYQIASMFGVGANLLAFTAASLLGAGALLAGVMGIGAAIATNFTGASNFVFASRQSRVSQRAEKVVRLQRRITLAPSEDSIERAA